jgi:TolA-binding protein
MMMQLGFSSKTLLMVFVVAATSGCAVFSTHKSETVDYRKRAADLARELKRKNAVIEDLKEKNQVLNTRAIRSSSAQVKTPLIQEASSVPQIVPAVPVVEAQKVVQKLPEKLETETVTVPTEKSEHLLYAKVMTAYRHHDAPELQKAVKIFLKTFPESAYADNAIYLSAMLGVQKNDLSYAHRALDHLLKEYATGNKAVAALFTKGALYKKQQKWQKARETFVKVATNFPGSPESQRVPLELRLVEHLEKVGPK